MSKTMEALLRSQEIQMKHYFSFMEKMYESLHVDLSESDINEMEKSYDSSSNPSVDNICKRSITNLALNNVNYNPKQGANIKT